MKNYFSTKNRIDTTDEIASSLGPRKKCKWIDEKSMHKPHKWFDGILSNFEIFFPNLIQDSKKYISCVKTFFTQENLHTSSKTFFQTHSEILAICAVDLIE